MTKRSRTPFLLVCAAVGIACGSESVFEPERAEPERAEPERAEPERASVFTTLEVRPIVADLFSGPGDTVQLSIAAWDEKGQLMVAGTPTYSSSAPAIAAVDTSGLVRAVAPGTAVITATMTLNGVSRTASMTATVHARDGASGKYSEIAGVYDLSAPITSFDPAWGDLTGYRYSAVLTLHQYSRDGFEGTYAHLQVVGPGGESDGWENTGFVKGSLDLDGGVVIHLTGGNHTWTSWSGRGKLGSGEIVGKFGCCGHISGDFKIVRRHAE